MQGFVESPDCRDLLAAYQDLRRLARAYLGRERPGATYEPTALVHEAFLRLLGTPGLEVDNREHLFRLAARKMRHLLVERARKHSARQRQLPLPLSRVACDPAGLVLIDQLLRALMRQDPRAARVFELTSFDGLTDSEAAHVLNLSVSTIRLDREYARSWIYHRMTAGPPENEQADGAAA